MRAPTSVPKLGPNAYLTMRVVVPYKLKTVLISDLADCVVRQVWKAGLLLGSCNI